MGEGGLEVRVGENPDWPGGGAMRYRGTTELTESMEAHHPQTGDLMATGQTRLHLEVDADTLDDLESALDALADRQYADREPGGTSPISALRIVGDSATDIEMVRATVRRNPNPAAEEFPYLTNVELSDDLELRSPRTGDLVANARSRWRLLIGAATPDDLKDVAQGLARRYNRGTGRDEAAIAIRIEFERD